MSDTYTKGFSSTWHRKSYWLHGTSPFYPQEMLLGALQWWLLSITVCLRSSKMYFYSKYLKTWLFGPKWSKIDSFQVKNASKWVVFKITVKMSHYCSNLTQITHHRSISCCTVHIWLLGNLILHSYSLISCIY